MFYPFSLTALSRDRGKKSRDRPLVSRDLSLAHAWCQTHLPRFPAYRRQVLGGQLTALLIGAAVPGIGHLAFGWPLQLLAISPVADCVAALWADPAGATAAADEDCRAAGRARCCARD